MEKTLLSFRCYLVLLAFPLTEPGTRKSGPGFLQTRRSPGPHSPEESSFMARLFLRINKCEGHMVEPQAVSIVHVLGLHKWIAWANTNLGPPDYQIGRLLLLPQGGALFEDSRRNCIGREWEWNRRSGVGVELGGVGVGRTETVKPISYPFGSGISKEKWDTSHLAPLIRRFGLSEIWPLFQPQCRRCQHSGFPVGSHKL